MASLSTFKKYAETSPPPRPASPAHCSPPLPLPDGGHRGHSCLRLECLFLVELLTWWDRGPVTVSLGTGVPALSGLPASPCVATAKLLSSLGLSLPTCKVGEWKWEIARRPCPSLTLTFQHQTHTAQGASGLSHLGPRPWFPQP